MNRVGSNNHRLQTGTAGSNALAFVPPGLGGSGASGDNLTLPPHLPQGQQVAAVPQRSARAEPQANKLADVLAELTTGLSKTRALPKS